tara:strand:- start:706 stop:885 length:180 start_codon:yes stop_codon:yes gene_type:complete
MRFFNSLFPLNDIANMHAGVKTDLNGLLGFLAPLATTLILPKFLVNKSTRRLVSLKALV